MPSTIDYRLSTHLKMYIIIFITTPNRKEAGRIAKVLLENKLAACVNIIGKLESRFWWEKKIDQAKETLLIVKSKKALLPKIISRVRSQHSYSVPEIIALPIIGGDKKYLHWLGGSLGRTG